MKFFFYTILIILKSINASEIDLDDYRKTKSQAQALAPDFSYHFQSIAALMK